VRWRILGHLAYTSLHLGDRAALDGAIDAMTSLGPEIGAVRMSMTRLHETMRSLIDGDVSGAERTANALVEQLEQLGVPEAVAYRSTTTLAISREQGTLAELGPVVDALVAGAHPVGPERTTAAFVRLLRGDLEIVRAALHDLDDQEFADDATVQLCVAFWAEIVAGLRSDEHCARFIDVLAPGFGGQPADRRDVSRPCRPFARAAPRGPRRTRSSRRAVRCGGRPAVCARQPALGGAHPTRLGVGLPRAW
jgi:hypothetical protein